MQTNTALGPPTMPASGRLGPDWRNRLSAITGGQLARASLFVPEIRKKEQQLASLSDEELLVRAHQLRGKARAGDQSADFITEGFALCSIAVWRALGMRAFDVQLAAGIIMFRGGLVELATGEGKTLTATFPAFLYALAGKGIHITTVNDYLAHRDGELLAPVFAKLGLSIGVLQMKMDDAQRAEVYRRDITYGTASEFGFDFLRDRLKSRGGQVAMVPFWNGWIPSGAPKPGDPRVQRTLYCALVDEADSIFVDEARTPLIISAPTRMANPQETIGYRWADDVAQKMKRGTHFKIDMKKDKVELTDEGRTLARYSNPPTGKHVEALDKLFEALERAVHANYRFVRDHHYMVLNEKVIIVDESTGRPMPDRHWREGLHQAVEAKEKVPIHIAAEHAAQVTYQRFYRMYDHLCGMSGTLVQNSRELRKVYKRRVVAVPTNRPIIREQWPDLVFPTWQAKLDAVVKNVKELQARGRPVLIGTRSVEKSEAVSECLRAADIKHQVLNAKQNEEEANIVAQAGRPGCVTVATNMAGRGTDIVLGGNISKDLEAIRADTSLTEDEKERRIAELRSHWQQLHEQVVAAGGLHVIGTERHEAIRIDRQLLGRAGRQGDPGSGQFYLCLEDELLEALGPKRQLQLELLGQSGRAINENDFRSLFLVAQRRVERKHFRQRLDTMHYERQRRETLSELGADPFVD